MRERKRKKKHVGGKKEKKKIRVFATPRLELSPFTLSQLSNTVYQRIELTQHIGPQSVYVSRALCINCIAELGQWLKRDFKRFKVAEHSFRARFCWCDSARAQGLQKQTCRQ